MPLFDANGDGLISVNEFYNVCGRPSLPPCGNRAHRSHSYRGIARGVVVGLFRPGPNDPTPPQYLNRRGAMRACSRSMAGIIPGAGFPVDLWVFSNEWHTGASQFSACAELQPMRTLCVVESTCRGYSLPVNSHCSFGAVHTLVAKDGLRHVR